jgi:hypothetical protein
MSAMATRTVAVSTNQLDTAIEALSSAGRAFRLTRFESAAYHALMVSVYVAAWSWVALLFLGMLADSGYNVEELGTIGGVVVACAVILATIALVLNIPLAARLYRERARLKELGLASLSKSLWKESRRGRWISRAFRWAPVIVIVIILPLGMVDLISRGTEAPSDEVFGALFCVIVIALLVLMGYLRNQRERMDLAASAEELKDAFQALQRRGGNSEKVSVPSELLEKAARIESVQIVKERKDAILQSIGNHSSGYSVTFDGEAANQRAALSVADRIELEDLVAQLSTAGPTQLDPRATPYAHEGERLDIEYKIDGPSRTIRIMGIVRHEGVANA